MRAFSDDTGIAQLAGPPALANPLSRRLGQPIGIGDMDVAAKANDVVEAKFAELGEQLLVAKPAVGQDRDQASWRHELAQAPQAGVLIIVALVLKVFISRRSATTKPPPGHGR
jgi:hypothetical protein